MRKSAFFVLAALSVLTAFASGEQRDFTGYVTDAGTPKSFEVNGLQVVCDPAVTRAQVRYGEVVRGKPGCPQHLLGEKLILTGTAEAGGSLHPTDVETVTLKDEHVKGTALILRILRPDEKGSVTVQADGYALRLSPETDLLIETGDPPTVSPFRPNLWIQYSGVLREDGTVGVSKAVLSPNDITPAEQKMRSNAEFDASKVTEADRQSGLSKHFAGLDWKRLPAYNDPVLQARVDAIGASLIPVYQRSLPDADPAKIDFRFQLVDDDKYAYYPMASGIILLSRSAVATEETDSQLAALLAEGIADVLQKQAFRSRSQHRAITGIESAGDVAGLFVPGVSLAGLAVGSSVNNAQQREWMQQRARISLTLLYDAGYDPLAAPRASWRLAQKKGKPLSATSMREVTQYFYETVYRVWSRQASPGPSLSSRAGSAAGIATTAASR